MKRTITTIEELRDLLPSWYGRPFAFDVETSGLSYRESSLLGLALSFPSDTHRMFRNEPSFDSYYVVLGHTVPLWDGSTTFRSFIDATEFATSLRGLFAQDVVQVAHNSKFDMHFLHRYGVLVEGKLFDTLLAAQLVDENRDNGLKDLAVTVGVNDMVEYKTLVEYPGFGREEILGVPLDKASNYAMKDTETAWLLYEKLQHDLASEGVEDAFYNVWMPLVPVLQQMEAKGIALDMERVREIGAEYQIIATEKEAIVRQEGIRMILSRYPNITPDNIPKYYLRFATPEELEAAYEDQQGNVVTDVAGIGVPIITKASKAYKPRVIDFNTGSDPQLKELVFDHLGVTVPSGVRLKTSPKTQNIALDKDNLSTLLFYNDDPPEALQAVLDWRKATKFLGTYIERFEKEATEATDWRISTSFRQDGTDTGRLSSAEPNLQNIPSRGEVGKQARSMFVAAPNCDLIVADLGQAELRMLAHYSQDEALMRAFAEGQDLHIVTGAAFGRMDYDALKAGVDAGEQWAKDLRSLGKTGNFALTYGMGPVKFQRYLLVNNKYEVTVDQAAEWIENYNTMYAGATDWKRRVMAFARRHGYVLTYKKRKRRLPGAMSGNERIRARAERQGVNATIQGSVGDIMSEAMPYVQAALAPLGGSLLLQVHDELVAEAPKATSQLCAKLMEELMVGLCNPHLRVPQVADAHIGPSWGEAKS